MKTLPIRHTLTFAYRGSFAIAVLIAVISAAGPYSPAPKPALGVTEAEAGLLVPGFLALAVYNLVVRLPILLTLLWLTHRGSLFGLLLWPGALFSMVYIDALYLVGAPFSVLFLAYVAIGAIMIGLAILTLASGAPPDPLARHVWLADLALEAPAILLGGALLWRHTPLGYVAGRTIAAVGPDAHRAGGQYRVPADPDRRIARHRDHWGLLISSLVCFASLAFFVRGAIQSQHSVAPPIAGAQG